MILVTRLNGSHFYINAELIQTVEPTPDCVISLINNVKIIVKEPAELIVERIIAYHQKANRNYISDHGNDLTTKMPVKD